MSSWAERVHRRAADFGSAVTSCGHPGPAGTTYPYRLEKVKFGVPLEEVCKCNDNIPGPLLVLILKLNKESPNRRDVFRAPGHQGAMKKLIHFLQAGRLVNVDNYSVYTIASVLKKFLRKIPNGIFGRLGEQELFAINEVEQEAEQSERLHRLFTSLPKYTQHLLVLLFGTFRVIASNAAHAGTGMTSEALGVSVAPSFFQTCVSDGKNARMEDVLKFKVATRIMKHIIDKFATHDIFGRDNYEYYARVTGRILKVQDEWICSFQYPPPPRGKLAQQKYALQHSLEAEKTWLQCQCERWGLLAQEESRSTPALLTSSSSALDNSVLSLGVTPEHSFIESCARLSVSLEGPGLFALTSSPIPKRGGNDDERADVLDLLDDDDNDVADDEDDDDDDDDDVHVGHPHDEDDFAAELEISNDDDIENNPRHGLLNKCLRNNVPRPLMGGGNNINDDDEDDDEVTVVKRRYRQNKKKTTTTTTITRVQHQRRLRTNASKSLDHAQLGNENLSPPPPTPPKPAHLQRMATVAATTATTEFTSCSTGNGAVLTRSNAANKTRTCSRCNRGIRHSSSCSSASGGNGGSHMTMEELRAVNRYAESTKSLSYLPQVHERQTARMRTRSEWFLGPEDVIGGGGISGLQTTCSNCCLVAQQQQQKHQQQQQQHAAYLGGGSVSNMLLQHDDAASDMYLLYMQRHKKQQKLLLQQAEHMDTDESNDFDVHQQQQQHHQHQHQQQLHSTAATAISNSRRLFLAADNLLPATATTAAATGTATATTTTSAAATNTVGNIRLSNSAESVQYPVRRPSRRGLLIGLPRHYPLRSSLRRNKEKQVNSSSNNSANSGINSNGNNSNSNSCDSNIIAAVAGVTVTGCQTPRRNSNSNRPPSVRNSIAECCSNISSNQQYLAMNSNILTNFPFNRVGSRTVSFENRQQLKLFMDDDADDGDDANDSSSINAASNMMDTSETFKTTTTVIENIPRRQQQQQAADVKSTQQTTASFKPPRV